MAAAFYLFLANVLASTFGPLIIGVLSDVFHEQYGDLSLRYSLLSLLVLTSVWSAAHFYMASRTLREDLAAANDLSK